MSYQKVHRDTEQTLFCQMYFRISSWAWIIVVYDLFLKLKKTVKSIYRLTSWALNFFKLSFAFFRQSSKKGMPMSREAVHFILERPGLLVSLLFWSLFLTLSARSWSEWPGTMQRFFQQPLLNSEHELNFPLGDGGEVYIRSIFCRNRRCSIFARKKHSFWLPVCSEIITILARPIPCTVFVKHAQYLRAIFGT